MNGTIDFLETVKQVLVATFHNESQIGRSMKDAPKAVRSKFKKQLVDSILQLVSEADNNTLTTVKIRDEIKRLASNSDVSVG